jgi:hypothetical protein
MPGQPSAVPLGQHPTDPTTPDNYVDRLNGITQAHPWMPLQTASALATSKQSDSMVTQMADAMRKAWATTQKVDHYLHDDPLLQKEPSLALKFKMYLSGAIGPWPIAESDVVHVQKWLLQHGYTRVNPVPGAPSLQPNGVWSNEWTQAYNIYLQALKASQLGGQTTGSVPFGKAVGWINDSLPKESWSSIIGFVQAFPESLANDARTLAGAISGGAYNLATSFEPHNLLNPNYQPNKQQQFQVEAAAENIVPGSHVTPQTAFSAQGFRSQAADVASVIGDLLVLHGALGVGSHVAQAAGETSLKDFSMEEATRGPGAIVKSLWYRAPDAAKPTGFFTNPIMRFTGPAVDAAVGNEGLYYRARTLLATPYAYGPIRVVGTASGQASLLGLKARAVANAESMIGGKTSTAQRSIDNYHGLDAIDNGIANKLSFSIGGLHFRNGLDTLAWFMHPPLSGPHAVSETIGKDIGSGHERLNDALGTHTGYLVNLERGINMSQAGGKYVKVEDVIQKAGGPENFAKWFLPKIWQYAAAHYADMQFRSATPEEIEQYGGRQQFMQAMIDRAYKDDHILREAAQEMKANNSMTAGWGGTDELSRRIANEIRNSRGGKDGVISNIQNQIAAGDIMRNVVVPRVNEIYGGENLPGDSLGLANSDYLLRQTALAQAQAFAEEYAQTLQRMNSDHPDPGDFAKLAGIAEQVRQWITQHWGIVDIPGDHQQLLNKAISLAEGQAGGAIWRDKETWSGPQRAVADLKVGAVPHLHEPNTLDTKVNTPLYRGSTVRDAIHTLFGEGVGAGEKSWVVNPPPAESPVIIEMDPSKLFGATKNPTELYPVLRGHVTISAARVNLRDSLDGVRSVDIKEGTTSGPLVRKLEAAGFKQSPYDGGVRWVHPEHAVGLPMASAELKKAFGDIQALGKQVIVGHNIGPDFYPHPHIDVMEGRLSAVRRTAERGGVSPENVGTGEFSFWVPVKAEAWLQKSIDNGKFRLMPYDSAHAIIQRLINVHPTHGLASSVYQLTPGFRTKLAQLTEELLPAEGENAADLARGQLLRSVENPMGILHLKPSEVKRALSQKINPDSAAGQHLSLHGIEREITYDDHAVQEMQRVLRRAAADIPWRFTGWQGIEYMLGKQIGFAGQALPGTLGRAIENLPSRFIRLRNQARFTLSPFFSARRLIKATVKTSLDGVPVSFWPLHTLMKMGVRSEALHILDRVMPEWRNTAAYDEGTQFQYANDIYGIYDFRHTEAHAAWHWAQQGKTDSEIRDLLIKDFAYGSKKYGEGRTGLERSLNFVFFPISFDKTLYRNVGAYLMDRPAQRMMLSAGLAAYAQFNAQHPAGDAFFSSPWWIKHAPIFQQAEYLNAFYHGVGIGQMGGINAPLLNLFLPQQWVANKGSLAVLQGFVPALKEFQNLYLQGRETLQTSVGQLEMMASHTPSNAQTGPGSVFMPQVVKNETDVAALHDAYAYRRVLLDYLGKDIQWNAHHKDKYTVGTDSAKFGSFAGQPISSTMVNEMVNLKYPQFKISDPAVFYDQQIGQINTYTEQMRAQGRQDVVTWIDAAAKVAKWIYKGNLGTQASATDTKIIRNYAIQYAERVPGFLKFYNDHFLWQFGPIQAVGGGGG